MRANPSFPEICSGAADLSGPFGQLLVARGAHLAVAHTALGVDDDRKRQAARLVAQCLGQLGAAEPGQTEVESYSDFGQKSLDRGRAVDGQSDDLPALRG